MSKILVPKTDYLVEIDEIARAISILGNPNWEITASFETKERKLAKLKLSRKKEFNATPISKLGKCLKAHVKKRVNSLELRIGS